ncbi:MAG: CBS domain-containing protein [Lachnospiraceae bacterium]
MNILFFLTPKEEVAYIYDDDTLRQTFEKMEHHRYSCIPIINRRGKYVGTITEGDILWGLKEMGPVTLKDMENIGVCKVNRKVDYKPVQIGAKMEDLIDRAMSQNFVPVVDDQKKFIGLITRKDIIQYCYEKTKKE